MNFNFLDILYLLHQYYLCNLELKITDISRVWPINNTNQKELDEKAPLVTIITAVLNGEKYLEKTINSIISQSYKNIEYIIIDGGSTDNTLNIIKSYERKIHYWISEKDQGISDAFNKGVKQANGVYINFQGDGDGFIEPNSLEKVFQGVNPNEDIFVSARIHRVNLEGKNIYTSKYIKKFHKSSLLFRMSLPHQGLFTHKNYFEEYGLFDTDCTFCMDYDHLLRSYRNFPKVLTKDITVAKWRMDGIGNGRTLEILEEYDKTKRKNKISYGAVLFFLKYWALLKYYINLMSRRD